VVFVEVAFVEVAFVHPEPNPDTGLRDRLLGINLCNEAIYQLLRRVL
jgi:hypothetical protein